MRGSPGMGFLPSLMAMQAKPPQTGVANTSTRYIFPCCFFDILWREIRRVEMSCVRAKISAGQPKCGGGVLTLVFSISIFLSGL